MNMLIRVIVALLLAAWVTPADAQPATPSPALTQRANEMPALLRGEIGYTDYFTPEFVAAVPESQFKAIVQQVVSANGAPTKVEGLAASSPHAASVELGFERAIATILLVVDPAAPHRVSGWRLRTARTRGDSVERIAADFAKLRGARGLLVTELGRDTKPLLAVEPDRTGAVGSVFKLAVLAEAARAVAAGERRWDATVPLVPDVLSSATTARWPAGMPITLQAAATAMIATSDNRATDTVMAALDPRRLERAAIDLGMDRSSLPFLTTQQALALKTRGFAPLADRWAQADEAGRRALLAENAAALAAVRTTAGPFDPGPRHIESVEWFASPRSMVRMLERLRLEGGAPALDALAVNRGVEAGLADRFAYVGYKGGSESGVIALAWLVRTKSGRWFAVAGWWNDPKAPVEDLTFGTLMSRALGVLPAE